MILRWLRHRQSESISLKQAKLTLPALPSIAYEAASLPSLSHPLPRSDTVRSSEHLDEQQLWKPLPPSLLLTLISTAGLPPVTNQCLDLQFNTVIVFRITHNYLYFYSMQNLYCISRCAVYHQAYPFVEWYIYLTMQCPRLFIFCVTNRPEAITDCITYFMIHYLSGQPKKLF